MSKVGVHKIPNGSLEVLADGTKIQKTNDGNKLVVHPDGTKVQTTKDVSRTMWGLVKRTGRRTHTKERPLWPHPTFHTRRHSAWIYSVRTQWTRTHGCIHTCAASYPTAVCHSASDMQCCS